MKFATHSLNLLDSLLTNSLLLRFDINECPEFGTCISDHVLSNIYIRYIYIVSNLFNLDIPKVHDYGLHFQ